LLSGLPKGYRASFKRFKWLIKTAWKGEIAKLVHVTLTDPERIQANQNRLRPLQVVYGVSGFRCAEITQLS
jgi:hypothetical protein